jgi:metal-responsive CopG/Arc/MetJ family transcriptional regulator
MQTQRINITLPIDLARDLRKTIPARSRSNFIAQALEDRLKRKKNLKKELLRSLKAQEALISGIQEDFKYIDAEAFEKLS